MAIDATEGRGGGRRGSEGSAAARDGVQQAPSDGKKVAAARESYSTFAISEEKRLRYTTMLKRLRENLDEEELRFPSTLDNIERKFIHHLSSQLGLVSKSRGKGVDRYLTVSKKGWKGGDQDDDDDGYPLLQLSGEATECLLQHVSRYRLSDAEREALLLVEEGEAHAAGGLTRGDHAVPAVKAQPPTKKAAAKPFSPSVRPASGSSAAASNRSSSPLFEARRKLPAWQYREALMELMRAHQVVVVSGETGCGKSTQVPQFILDDEVCGLGLRMAVTQPRRISAIALAERVAAERGEEVGSSIGYTIRLEHQVSDATQVTFMTPGVLLRRLRNDPALESLTCVVLDEVHERDRDTDFLLIVLRDLLPQRPDLRLVLMSATLQTQKLSLYFGGAPVIAIGCTRFPVQEFFLEDALVQTGYSKSFAPSMSSSSSSSASQTSAALLKQLCVKGPPVYSCDICGRKGFRSPEEYGTHVVLCDGVSDGVNSGVSSSEAVNFKDLETKLLEDIRTGAPAVAFDEEGSDDVWISPPPLLPVTVEAVVASNGEQEGATDERPAWAQRRHDPLVGGVWGPGSSAGVGNVEAQEALRAYQFNWDDEMVDNNLIRELLRYICGSGYEDGAVLVFLPGWDDISRLRDCLRRDSLFGREDRFWILPLHSGIPSRQQRQVFARPPPGVRKIVLSTNIAETSLTIDDVVFVVDTARVKEKAYDPHLKLCTLQPTWISKASARQRKGRAGRTTAGVCFHLCSRRRYEALKEFRESELLTTPLEELCLQAKAMGVAPGGPSDPEHSLSAFLSHALDPPHHLAVKNALELLAQIGALDASEQLTDLGWKLSSLPLDPRIGKMVLWGQLLGCGRSAIKVGCTMAYRDPFVLPLTSADKARADRAKLDLLPSYPPPGQSILGASSSSDHLALLAALSGYERALQSGGMSEAAVFCDRHFLSRTTLNTVLDVAKQLVSELGSLGFQSPFKHRAPSSDNDDNQALLAAVICAGLYPNLARRKLGDLNFITACGKKAKIHQSSVNSSSGSRYARTCMLPSRLGLEMLVFSEVVRTPSVFLMSNTTPVPLLAPLLLCGSLRMRRVRLNKGDDADADEALEDGEGAQGVKEDDQGQQQQQEVILELDDWLVMRCSTELAAQIQLLRLRLQHAFLTFIKRPQARMSEAHQDAIRCTVLLLALQDQEQGGQGPQRAHSHHSGMHAGGARITGPQAALMPTVFGGAGGASAPQHPQHVHQGGRYNQYQPHARQAGPPRGNFPFQPPARRGGHQRGGGHYRGGCSSAGP